MSDFLEKVCGILQEKVDSASLSNSVKFVIEDEGALTINDGQVAIEDAEADVTLIGTAEVFEEILSGETSGASAFMGGRLKIEGDMGLAMQLGSILG